MKKKRKKVALKPKVGDCYYCGITDKLTIDHVIPRSKGGTNKRINKVLACAVCNTLKSSLSLPGFMRLIRSRVKSLKHSGRDPEYMIQQCAALQQKVLRNYDKMRNL